MTDNSMANNSCRAAMLTPNAPGAIAVILVVGPDLVGRVGSLLRRFSSDASVTLTVGRPTPVRIVDGATWVDEAVVLLRRRGSVESMELSTHGGARVVEVVLALLARRGVAVVPPEELVGAWADDPIERDVDRALLRCESRRLTQWLLIQRGILPGYLTGAATIPAVERETYNLRTAVAIRLVAGLRVALVGPPNAGKSTLANRLIGHDRVITSDQPGTTRDWVEETALIGGWPVTLTDTAGVRATDDPIESEAIRRGRARAQAADLAVIVLDGSASAERVDADVDTMTAMLPPGQARVVVLNKSDWVGDRVRPVAGWWADSVWISARDGSGIAAMEAALIRGLKLDVLDCGLPTGFLGAHCL